MGNLRERKHLNMKISLKRKYAAVLPLILSIAVLLLLGCQAESQDGRSEFTDHAAELSRTKDAYNNKEEMPDDNPDYEVKYIELKDTQKNNILKKLSDVMEKCAPIYSQAADASSPGGVLAEDDIHRMADLIAQDKKAVICGSRDDNMRNYEEVDSAIRRGKAGKNAGAEFYSVNTNGIFRYYKLEFEKENLFVTFASAVYHGSLMDDTKNGNKDVHQDMTPTVQQIEKICTYQWDYTEKGWLIWEKALSRNQEMDMHIFYRILPLDSECRRLSKKCIEPVSYFSNNLFLTDWDASDLSQLEFNDLFDSFYYMSSGRRPDKDIFRDGIPKQEFEDTIQRYLDIETGELEQRAFYDKKKGTYPWLAITGWNRLPQLQPFPEVTDCKENGDDTLDLYVDAVFVEEGTDRAFSHVVTVKEKDDGGFVYLGNKIDQEHVLHMPVYRPRREF